MKAMLKELEAHCNFLLRLCTLKRKKIVSHHQTSPSLLVFSFKPGLTLAASAGTPSSAKISEPFLAQFILVNWRFLLRRRLFECLSFPKIDLLWR